MSAPKKPQGKIESEDKGKEIASPKTPGSKTILKAAADGKSAASVAHADPEADGDDDDAHALHGAKLLNTIASAHLDHIQKMKSKKSSPSQD